MNKKELDIVEQFDKRFIDKVYKSKRCDVLAIYYDEYSKLIVKLRRLLK